MTPRETKACLAVLAAGVALAAELLFGNTGMILPVSGAVIFYFAMTSDWKHALLLAIGCALLLDFACGRSFPAALLALPMAVPAVLIYRRSAGGISQWLQLPGPALAAMGTVEAVYFLFGIGGAHGAPGDIFYLACELLWGTVCGAALSVGVFLLLDRIAVRLGLPPGISPRPAGLRRWRTGAR